MFEHGPVNKSSALEHLLCQQLKQLVTCLCRENFADVGQVNLKSNERVCENDQSRNLKQLLLFSLDFFIAVIFP